MLINILSHMWSYLELICYFEEPDIMQVSCTTGTKMYYFIACLKQVHLQPTTDNIINYFVIFATLMIHVNDNTYIVL